MFKTQPQFYWNLCFITFIKEVNVFGNVCVHLLEWSHMLRWTVNNLL